MIKLIKKILIAIIIIILIYSGGAITGYIYRGKAKPKFKIVKQTEIKTKIVVRNIYKMPRKNLLSELSKYDQGQPELEIIQLNQETIKATARLHRREWSREATLKIEVASNSNWKLYIGIGSGIFIVGGLTGILIARKR